MYSSSSDNSPQFLSGAASQVPPIRIGSIFGTLIISLIAAVLLASLYSAICHYVPVVHYLGILVILFGVSLGAVVKATGNQLGASNTTLQLVIGIVAGLIAIYTAWAWNVVSRFGWDAFPINFSPMLLLNYIRILYVEGSFTIDGNTPTGITLACIWLAEAAVVLAGLVVVILKTPTESPIKCPRCGRPLQARSGVFSTRDRIAEDFSRLAEGDLDALDNFQKEAGNEDDVLTVTVARCPGCTDRITVSIEHLIFTESGDAHREMLCDALGVSSDCAEKIEARL